MSFGRNEEPPTLGKGGISGSCLTLAASLLFIRLLKHIRWNIATYPDCVSAERHHRGCDTKGNVLDNWNEFFWDDCCYLTVSHLCCRPNLPCVSAPRGVYHDKVDLLLIVSTLCRRAMSYVSMWWWAERKWHGRSQRTGSQKKKNNKKHEEKKERILLWNPTSTQGPVLKETSNKSWWLPLRRVN